MWNVFVCKGFFLVDGVVGNVFYDIFKIFEFGIYFVVLNLMIMNVSDGFLKVFLVINNDVEVINGIEGLFGNMSFDGMLSFFGFLCFY